MSSTTVMPNINESFASEEDSILKREAGLLIALEDAELEASEVRAFASDVRTRLARHADAGSDDVKGLIASLDALNLPSFSPKSFEDRRRMLRLEALRARQVLAESLDSELESGHGRIDAALDLVRRARDLMMRGRLRRPTPEATAFEHGDVRATATVVAPAIALSSPDQGAPTRANIRPNEVSEPVTVAQPVVIRASHRRKLETHVDFGSDSNFFSGFSSNISDGGLFIATSIEMANGVEIEVSLTLPDAVALRARCIVRWSRPEGPDLPAGLGVEFIGIDQTARDAIQRFMQKREPIFDEV